MKLLLTEESWILDELNPIEWRFLSQLPDLAAGTGLPRNCRRRLKPNPLDDPDATGANQSEFMEDWREYVEPELDGAFRRDREGVATDLTTAEIQSDQPLPERLVVPNGNSEIWYSVINQARLLLNEAYQLAESQDRFDPDVFASDVGMEQILLMAQYEFYTAIQSILIEHRMKP